MSEQETGYIAPFCEGAEQYCHAYMEDGSVACEDCHYSKKEEG